MLLCDIFYIFVKNFNEKSLLFFTIMNSNDTTNNAEVKGRFAPSPSGRMHLGNVYAALMSWLSVKSKGGKWLLRIEDLDPQRCKLDYALQLEDDLNWLGLSWDEGGTAENCMQSKRSDIYEEYLSKLKTKHLTYPCHCTRADIMATQAPHESDGRIVYKGTCRPDDLTMPLNYDGAAVRLCVPDEVISFEDGHYGTQDVNLMEHCGDFIIRRKDGAWAYQLAVVVDDALMGVTEIVRGNDLLLSTPQQIYLHRLLGFMPPAFIHHPLLCNDCGQRLSKRDKSLDLGMLRQKCSPEDLIGYLAFQTGLIPQFEPIPPTDLLPLFSWEKIPKDNIHTDITLDI